MASGAQPILLESSEASLFDLQSVFDGANAATCYLGSVDDPALLEEIFAVHHPALVFHAAAFKHVPLLESQPLAAISNNVFGTEKLAVLAAEHRSRIILLSTDKAVAPASMMGATKRIAEQIILQSGGTVVRLGNVLDSRGSVSRVFMQQIAAGHPLTVTDPAARRYFLTLAEAVNLLLTTACEPSGPAVFAPRLETTHYVADLARFLSRTLAPDREVRIKFTEPRPGDKETEELWSTRELLHAASCEGLIQLDSPTVPHLGKTLALLHDAVSRRDLPAAISAIKTLVPDYSPSSAVLAQCASAPSQLSHD
jgi:FlaA1/EpsC-like NDP-sugar epimerase